MFFMQNTQVFGGSTVEVLNHFPHRTATAQAAGKQIIGR